MTREEYLESIFKAFNEDRISVEALDAALMNIEAFVNED